MVSLFHSAMRSCLSTALFWAFLSTVQGQEYQGCNTLSRSVDKAPAYPGGTVALARYMQKELMPVVNECYVKDSVMITRLEMELMIDQKGQVLEVAFSGVSLPTACRERLRQRLLLMKGWDPARRKGVAVCSYYKWSIACILWQEG